MPENKVEYALTYDCGFCVLVLAGGATRSLGFGPGRRRLVDDRDRARSVCLGQYSRVPGPAAGIAALPVRPRILECSATVSSSCVVLAASLVGNRIRDYGLFDALARMVRRDGTDADSTDRLRFLCTDSVSCGFVCHVAGRVPFGTADAFWRRGVTRRGRAGIVAISSLHRFSPSPLCSCGGGSHVIYLARRESDAGACGQASGVERSVLDAGLATRSRRMCRIPGGTGYASAHLADGIAGRGVGSRSIGSSRLQNRPAIS